MFDIITIIYAVGAVVTFVALLSIERKNLLLSIAVPLSVLWPITWIVVIFFSKKEKTPETKAQAKNSRPRE